MGIKFQIIPESKRRPGGRPKELLTTKSLCEVPATSRDPLWRRMAFRRQLSVESCDEIGDGDEDGRRFSAQSLQIRQDVAAVLENSAVFTAKEKRHFSSLPRFGRNELTIGEILGTGEFGVVKEITRVELHSAFDALAEASDMRSLGSDKTQRRINLKPRLVVRRKKAVRVSAKPGPVKPAKAARRRSSHSQGARMRRRSSQGERQFIAKHCIRDDGNARFAMKTIKSEKQYDKRSFYGAALDLAKEAHFLSALEHPNIIKLRGVAVDEPGDLHFFLVLDRLYDTLTKRKYHWEKRQRKAKRYRLLNQQRYVTKQKILFDEQLTVAADLADALDFLHSRKIMHRDLKPDNIGFDVRGDAKIFDFGLAREVKPDSIAMVGDRYRLSGKTGSMRYMAPEVFFSRPYNESVDVYSLGLVLWGIFALDTPFAGYDEQMMKTQVFRQDLRPPMNKAWPEAICSMLSKQWSYCYEERPTAQTVTRTLKKHLLELRGGDDTGRGLNHTRRRSTFVNTRHLSTLLDATKTNSAMGEEIRRSVDRTLSTEQMNSPDTSESQGSFEQEVEGMFNSDDD